MFWKYYARLLAGIFVVGTVVILLRARSIVRPVDLLDWVVTLVSLVGLFGYAWKRQLFSRVFWAAFLPISLVWDLAYEVALHNRALFPRETEGGWLESTGARLPTSHIGISVNFAPPLYRLNTVYPRPPVMPHRQRGSTCWMRGAGPACAGR